MAATPRDVHMLTHTARMILAVEGKPKHKGRREYDAQIVAYQARWSAMSKADRAEAANAALQIHDMTKPVVNAAVAALEG